VCTQLLSCKAEFAIGGMVSTETSWFLPESGRTPENLRADRFHSTAIEKT
jgi:hypothetical protein